MQPRNATNITTATTTTVKTGRGILGKVIINTPAAGTITIYDSATATGTKIGTIAASATGTFSYDAFLLVGLTIVTGGATDLTIIWE